MDINDILNNREDLIGIRWGEIQKLYIEIVKKYNVPPELMMRLHYLFCAQIEHDRQLVLDQLKDLVEKKNSK